MGRYLGSKFLIDFMSPKEVPREKRGVIPLDSIAVKSVTEAADGNSFPSIRDIRALSEAGLAVNPSILTALRSISLVPLKGFDPAVSCDLWGLNMFCGPTGSGKDVIGFSIIADYERKGLLDPNDPEKYTVIEATSGNTGISVAQAARIRGYNVKIIIPEEMSAERKMLIQGFGAQLIETPGKGTDVDKAYIAAQIEGARTTNSIVVNQFTNPANTQAQYDITGGILVDSISRLYDRDARIVFVDGIGSGGTISGVGRRLKEDFPNALIVVAEPYEAPAIFRGVPLAPGEAQTHEIEGIGDGFIPWITDSSVMDFIVTVSDKEAIHTAAQIARARGIALPVGISSGCNVRAAVMIAQHLALQGTPADAVIPILMDNSLRYGTTKLGHYLANGRFEDHADQEELDRRLADPLGSRIRTVDDAHRAKLERTKADFWADLRRRSTEAVAEAMRS